MKICITVDMDNVAEYARLVSAPVTSDTTSLYFDSVPRFLDLFDRMGVRGTFFVVGRDARRRDHQALLREIAQRGHELANHSYSHPYNFRALSRQQKLDEIARAESAIGDVVGKRPVGFRAPSCDVDLETLRLLSERGYFYDSSVFPSWVMWVFMLYGRVFVRRRDYQLGELRGALAPARPYRPSGAGLHQPCRAGERDAPDILEFPFSATPGLRLPFYGTFLRLLSTRAFDGLLRLHGRNHEVLVVLLHLADLADMDGPGLEARLRRTPGVAVSMARRTRFFEHVVGRLVTLGQAVPLREAVGSLRPEPRAA